MKQTAVRVLAASLLFAADGAALATETLELSAEEVSTLQKLSKAILTAPTAEILHQRRTQFSASSPEDPDNLWLKMLDILVDHRHAELDQENNTAAAQKGQIKDKELDRFVDDFAGAYAIGDIKQFMQLFAPHAKGSNGDSAKSIEAAYTKLFSQTTWRRITIKDVKWQKYPDRAHGSGTFEVEVTRKNARTPNFYTGKIVFSVARHNDGLLFTDLDYSSCQLDHL